MRGFVTGGMWGMANYSTNEFKNGLKVLLEGEPCSILENEFVKPGKGQAFNRVKLRNLMNGRVMEKTFKSGDSIEGADVMEIDLQYLYNDGENMVFMDQQTYDQIPIPPDVIGEQEQFMMEEMIVDVLFWKGNPVNVQLPNYIESKVVQSDPGVKGDTSSGANKPATLECGATVNVPLFIKEGDILRVDTRTGEYAERVSG